MKNILGINLLGLFILFFDITNISSQEIFCFPDEWATGKYNFVDNQNKTLFSGNFYLKSEFTEGMGIVQFTDFNNTLAYVNAQGKVFIPQFPKNSFGMITLYPFSNGYGLVRRGVTAGRSGIFFFINKNGEKVSETYTDANSFSEGMAVVQSNNGTYRAIDTNFRTLFEIRSADHNKDINEWQFKSGLLPVMNIREEWGYIDKTGQLVIQPRIEFGNDFYGDFAISRSNRFIYNKSGKVVYTVESKYDIRNQPMRRFFYIFNDKLVILDYEFTIHNLVDQSKQDIVVKIENKSNPLSYSPLSRYHAYNLGEYMLCYDGIYDYSGNKITELPNNGVYTPTFNNYSKEKIWYNRYWVQNDSIIDLFQYIKNSQ